jgi:hypothetical protein
MAPGAHATSGSAAWLDLLVPFALPLALPRPLLLLLLSSKVLKASLLLPSGRSRVAVAVLLLVLLLVVTALGDITKASCSPVPSSS